MRLITEARFAEALQGRQLKSVVKPGWNFESYFKYSKICRSELSDTEYYFEDPASETLAMWIPEFSIYTIPVDQEFPTEEPKIEVLDWELSQIHDRREPTYIMNQYKRGGICCHSYLPLTSGFWSLKNIRTGETFEFSAKAIKQEHYYYHDQSHELKIPEEEDQYVYFCYPTKTEDVIRLREIRKYENFLCLAIYLVLTNGNTKSPKEEDKGRNSEG